MQAPDAPEKVAVIVAGKEVSGQLTHVGALPPDPLPLPEPEPLPDPLPLPEPEPPDGQQLAGFAVQKAFPGGSAVGTKTVMFRVWTVNPETRVLPEELPEPLDMGTYGVRVRVTLSDGEAKLQKKQALIVNTNANGEQEPLERGTTPNGLPQ